MASFEIFPKPDPTEVASNESSSELPRTTKTFICVETTDLEAFIKKAIGKTYYVRPSERQTPQVVSNHYAGLHQGLYQSFKTTRFIPGLATILNGLYSEGLIPAGRYLIGPSM